MKQLPKKKKKFIFHQDKEYFQIPNNIKSRGGNRTC